MNNESEFKLLTSWDAEIFNGVAAEVGMISEEEWNQRNARLRTMSRLSQTPYTENVASLIPMAWYEEAIVCVVWCGFLGAMLFTPFIFLWLLCCHRMVFYYALAAFVGLQLLLPHRFRPSLCKGYLAKLMLKYFSHRGIWKEHLPIDRPSIIVAPPHGLFPFGSLLACISVPRITGLFIRGLAADALLRIPIVGTRMRALGLTSASRDNARKMLQAGWSLGISSGGIAEIFETTIDGGVETIILKSRGGIAKLALETGAYLVPSFIFGNTMCLKTWQDPWGAMRKLSRWMRVSVVVFTGRFGLPIPFRVPLLGVLGSPIIVPLTPNPTNEQVAALLAKLEGEVMSLFEAHKESYGWKNVQLVIK